MLQQPQALRTCCHAIHVRGMIGPWPMSLTSCPFPLRMHRFESDNERIASVSEDASVCVFHVHDEAPLWTQAQASGIALNDVCFQTNSTLITAGCVAAVWRYFRVVCVVQCWYVVDSWQPIVMARWCVFRFVVATARRHKHNCPYGIFAKPNQLPCFESE